MSSVLSDSEHADAIAANLPSGRLWAAKSAIGTNLRGLIEGLAPTMRSIDTLLERFVEQGIPTETDDFLSEWEAALGIPDECFDLGTTEDSRRFVIEVKLAVLAGISTEPDFVALASIFGLEITAKSGIDHVPLSDGGYQVATPALTIPGDFPDVATARMTLVITESYPEAITFPWEFPLLFATDGQSALRCLIQKLAPANVTVFFQENI